MTKQEQIRFTVNKVLPAVYDDSLSYVENLAKVMHAINEVIENNNEVIETVEGQTETIANIHTSIRVQRGDIDQNTVNIERNTNSIDAIKTKNNTQDAKILTLESQVSALNTKTSVHDTDIENLVDLFNSEEERINALDETFVSYADAPESSADLKNGIYKHAISQVLSYIPNVMIARGGMIIVRDKQAFYISNNGDIYNTSNIKAPTVSWTYIISGNDRTNWNTLNTVALRNNVTYSFPVDELDFNKNGFYQGTLTEAMTWKPAGTSGLAYGILIGTALIILNIGRIYYNLNVQDYGTWYQLDGTAI